LEFAAEGSIGQLSPLVGVEDIEVLYREIVSSTALVQKELFMVLDNC